VQSRLYCEDKKAFPPGPGCTDYLLVHLQR